MSSAPLARERGAELLHVLFLELAVEPDVSSTRMFNRADRRPAEQILGFVDHLGGLIVKVPSEEVGRTIAAGEGEHVTMATRTMKEWVRLPYPEGGDPRQWRDCLLAARTFVSGDAAKNNVSVSHYD